MKKILFALLLTFIIVPAVGKAEDEQVLKLHVDKWCPYNCDTFTQRQGYMIDVVREIFGQIGYKVDYQLKGWTQALEDTKNGSQDAVVAPTQQEGKDLVLPKVSFGSSRYVFLKRSDDEWTYNGLSSLEGKKIGIMDNFVYSDEIQNYVKTHKDNIVVYNIDNDIKLRLWALTNKNIDVLLEDENVVRYGLVTNQLEDKFIIAGYDTILLPVYIGFSPKNPKSELFAKVMDAGIESMRKTGRLQEILNAYGLKDWQ